MKIQYIIIVGLVLALLLFLAVRAEIDERQRQLDLPTEVLKSVSKMTGETEFEKHIYYVITEGGDLKLFVSRSNRLRKTHTLESVSAPGPTGWKDEYRRYTRKPGMGWNDEVIVLRYSESEALAMFVKVLDLPLPEDEIFNETH